MDICYYNNSESSTSYTMRFAVNFSSDAPPDFCVDSLHGIWITKHLIVKAPLQCFYQENWTRRAGRMRQEIRPATLLDGQWTIYILLSDETRYKSLSMWALCSASLLNHNAIRYATARFDHAGWQRTCNNKLFNNFIEFFSRWRLRWWILISENKWLAILFPRNHACTLWVALPAMFITHA